MILELRARCGKRFYFILSSEIMENISVIKVVSIYREMMFSIISLYVDLAGTTFFDPFGLISFRKD